jgi:L-asparaginase
MSRKPSALIIYTGGTIGMVKDSQTGSLKPVNFERLQANIPEIEKLEIELDIYTFENTIDSSNVQPSDWIRLVEVIEKNYERYDGFVILHGSDTMAYTASALSFMLENLSKPVILTGSQLPIGVLRTDAKENFITALEIAALKEFGMSKVSEVCIYFEYHLLKGNRTTKFSSSHFNAFASTNYPALAEAGVQIRFNDSILRYQHRHSQDFPGNDAPVCAGNLVHSGFKSYSFRNIRLRKCPNRRVVLGSNSSNYRKWDFGRKRDPM